MLAAVIGIAISVPCGAFGQNADGSTAGAVGGAVLGAASGSMLGLIGGLEGCNRTHRPSRCSRITTAAGAAIGLTAGAAIGWDNTSGLDDRLENAAWGAAAGVVLGTALRRFVRHYEWSDVASVTVLGAAIGASAKGSGLGFAAGSAIGLLLWQLDPSVGPGGAVAWGLAGLAVGGLASWVVEAVRGVSEPGGLPLVFSVGL